MDGGAFLLSLNGITGYHNSSLEAGKVPVSKGNPFDDFYFVVDPFDYTIVVGQAKGVLDIHLIFFQGAYTGLKVTGNF